VALAMAVHVAREEEQACEAEAAVVEQRFEARLAQIGRSVPVAGWLSQQWLRSWLAEGAAAMRELPRFQRHPLVQRVYPPEVLDRLLLL
jgi:hypothetical protein